MHISQLKNQIPQLIERSSYPYISVYKLLVSDKTFLELSVLDKIGLNL